MALPSANLVATYLPIAPDGGQLRIICLVINNFHGLLQVNKVVIQFHNLLSSCYQSKGSCNFFNFIPRQLTFFGVLRIDWLQKIQKTPTKSWFFERILNLVHLQSHWDEYRNKFKKSIFYRNFLELLVPVDSLYPQRAARSAVQSLGRCPIRLNRWRIEFGVGWYLSKQL